jgi:hypothetical protein
MTIVHTFTEPAYQPPSGELFNLVQFFPDGTYEYVRERVSAEEAGKAFHHYTHSVGARMGTTVRVIITDGGDCTNAEWKHGEGLIYPPPEIANKEGATP